jgi:hypothetical protein
MRPFVHIVVWMLALCTLQTARSAMASDLRPELAATLEALSVRDRELLATAAHMTAATCQPRACPELEALDSKWNESLGRIISRLAAIGGLDAAALAHLLDPTVFRPSDLRRELNGYGEDIAKKLLEAKPPTDCQMAAEQLKAYATDNSSKADLFQLSLDLPTSRHDAPHCLEHVFTDAAKLKATRNALDGHVLMAIAAKTNRGATSKATLHVVSLETDASSSRFGSEYFTAEGSPTSGGYTVFLVPLRVGSRVTTRLWTPGQMLPEVRTFNVDSFKPYELRPPTVRCLEWSDGDQRDDSVEIFVDDERVREPMVLLPKFTGNEDELQAHELRVVRRGTPAQVLFRLSIPAKDLPSPGCYQARVDLRPLEELRDIAVVQATADPNCLRAGVDSQRVRERVERFFHNANRRTRDTQAWAETITGYNDLINQLKTLGEPAMGAPRGALDTHTLLGTGAAELARQGFGSLVFVTLTCTQGERAWDFALRARVANIASLVQVRDQIKGLDLEDVTRSELEVVTGVNSLDGAFIAALSRAFSSTYLRFEPTRERPSYHSRVAERFRVYLPSRGPRGRPADDANDAEDYIIELGARRFRDEEDAFNVCSAVETSQRLRASQRADDWWRQHERDNTERASTPIHARPGIDASYELAWNPRVPGRYLARGRLAAEDGSPVNGETVTYHCVDVSGGHTRLALDASYAVDTPFTGAHDARAGQLQYVQFMLSLSRATSENGNFFLGVALGYADAIHSLATPPSWDLPAAGSTGPTYGTDGALPLTWTRQSLQIGPTLSYEVPAALCAFHAIACTRAARVFGLVGRVIPVADIGSIDASAIPNSLSRFSDGARGLDLTISTFVQAGVTGQIDELKGLYLLGNLGLIGWTDYLMRDQQNARSKISYGANITLGLVVGAAYSL